MSERPQTASPIATGGRARPSASTQRSDQIAVSALTLDFLHWLAAGPRPYAEVMEAWRTSCPRLSIWEDALADGLVVVECASGARAGESSVHLTTRGRAALEAATTQDTVRAHSASTPIRS